MLLDVHNLTFRFLKRDGSGQPAVEDVSLSLDRGCGLAIVGESGSGKSVTAQTLMGLTRGQNAQIEGTASYRGRNLVNVSEREMRGIRGAEIAMIFQDPMTSLNPVYRVGAQIVEAIQAHEDVSKSEAEQRVVELLRSVGIPNPDERVRNYPHEFSGGMRQRAMIAMGLSLEPEVLIADEPTTALDVTIQAQILHLLQQINRDRGLAVIIITHDLGVVAEVADRVVVMYAGRVVEEGTLDEIFYDPQHPYTWGLLGSLTRLDRPRPKRLPQIRGLPPSLLSPPKGCHFRPRCPHAFSRCEQVPALEARTPEAPAHLDRCWLTTDQKRALRVVEGQIGLESPAA